MVGGAKSDSSSLLLMTTVDDGPSDAGESARGTRRPLIVYGRRTNTSGARAHAHQPRRIHATTTAVHGRRDVPLPSVPFRFDTLRLDRCAALAPSSSTTISSIPSFDGSTSADRCARNLCRVARAATSCRPRSSLFGATWSLQYLARCQSVSDASLPTSVSQTRVARTS